MRQVSLAILIGLAAMASIGSAKAPPPLKFLTQAEIAPADLLPPPSAPDSAATQAELAELHRFEAARTPRRLAQAKADDENESGSAFADTFGARFDLRALPATQRLLADVQNDEKIAAGEAKTWFHRDRPWMIDSTLQSCSKSDKPGSSYPSGHATMAYSMAVVLAAAAPAKAPALFAKAKDYSESRLVCGVHFRSDIVAGQALGTAVGVALLHNAGFRPELAAAARELKAAHLAG